MLKIIIVDDELAARDSLENFLNMYCNDVKILAKSANLVQAKKDIESLNPDLVLLDIRLKKGTGFDLLESIEHIDFQVIFTTAYDEYAIKAFKFNAIDYLLKPIDVEELEKAIDKAKDRIKQNSAHELSGLLQQLKTFDHSKPSLTISTEQSYEFLPIEQIIRLEANGSYTLIITPKKNILSSKILKDFESLLIDYKFYRVHHSHIINVNQMARFIKTEGGMIEMNNGDLIPVSRRKKEAFLELFVRSSAPYGRSE